MVIAAGSYPAGRWFESDRRYHIRLLGQAVKTSPFHGGNTGSIPVGVTIWGVSSVGRASALQAGGHRFEPCTPHQENVQHIVFLTNNYTICCFFYAQKGAFPQFFPNSQFYLIKTIYFEFFEVTQSKLSKKPLICILER